MNIVEILREAWKDRNKYNYPKQEEIFKNLISHGYNKINKIYRKKDPEYGDTLFIVIQDILIWIIFSDQEFIQAEYDAYLKFADYANFEPLSVQKCIDRKKQLDVDYVISLINHIVAARKHIPENDYESFVKSLCLISMFGDSEIDKEEYELISCFFTSEGDYSPSWEDFLKEW